jgi:hypothetical protein
LQHYKTFEMGENMPKNESVQVLPSVFAESTYLLDGRPFRLTDRHYLKPIYDGDIEEGMIMSGRQVEKSTTESTHMANYTLLIPYFKALYFAPLTDQVRTFSRERIGRLYDYSQENVIKKDFIDKNNAQAVMLKEFSNGSVNYFKHCFELGDNIRGITVNGIWGDEIQDIHIDALPVIKETQAHALEAGAKMRVTWYTGTPKTYSNTIQQYWDKSTQNEWVVKCSHCGKYQIMGVKNLSPRAFLCVKCQVELERLSIINGRWYALQTGKKLQGFRISQLMVPWIRADDIWEKYTTYSSEKFHNEVLGRSYENAEKPFNPLILAQISNNDLRLYPRAENVFANTKNFMGIDWGKGEKSFTVVTIFSHSPLTGKFQMLYCKRYQTSQELDPDYQVRDISNLMVIFKVCYCIADWGFGFVQYKKLQQSFGARVAACYYSFNQKLETKWDPVDQKWVVNRTKVISNYIKSVYSLQVEWPGREKEIYIWLFDHHLAEQAEYRKSQNGRSEDLMYNNPEGQPDDGMHSCVYAQLAAVLHPRSNAAGVVFANAYGGNI